MNQQKKIKTDIEHNLHKWNKEIETQGFITDEGPLFLAIKSLKESEDKVLFSQLLTLAALSRFNRGNDDSIVRAWIKKALELNRENKTARMFQLTYEWKNQNHLFAELIFPTIRETDNRPAKKKAADQYIDICRRFLNHLEEHLEKMNAHLKSLQGIHGEAINQYSRAIELIKEAILEAAALLKAAEEYEQSITGVFYTSTHFQDMKFHQNKLEDLKYEWEALFNDKQDKQKADSALDELNKMVGLVSVKQRVNSFYHFLKYQRKRKALGFQTKDELSLNMILTGNPGTGKTTLSRLFAKIYHELGVLPSEDVIEADRSQLVGAYVGQTEENVSALVERALGGVLFIDEAYSLKREGQTGNDYGQTAIDTLVSLMTGKEYGGKFAVILAGYPDEMRQFLDANPGLRSRFPQSNHLHLSDYSSEELLQIAENVAADNDYSMTKEAKMACQKRLEKEKVDETFGNARTARDLVLNAIFKKGSKADIESILSFTLLEEQDFALDEEGSIENPKARLEQLIGLRSVKEEVTTLVSFVRVQQLRREQGLPVVPIQLHAVFTGNPGTGKTTVAKIYAELLKECGMLKRGHLIVSSRADFVAGYVGQTAIKTKKKIREALGGVLFIDEAYSLLGQTSGDFGKEVIDTLVDEMTKHNENLVVILAGYPTEMELLLDSNPGLRSRFKKFIAFPDYSSKELLQIIESYAGKYQYILTPDLREYLEKIFSEVTVEGNGRFATNLIDEAIQAQALRLVSTEEFDKRRSILLEREDVTKALNKIRKGE